MNGYQEASPATLLRWDSVTSISVCVSFLSSKVVAQKLPKVKFNINFQFTQQLSTLFVYTYLFTFIKMCCMYCVVKRLTLNSRGLKPKARGPDATHGALQSGSRNKDHLLRNLHVSTF